jgi:hypothetical protein
MEWRRIEMKVELMRVRVKKGKSQRVDEWMSLLNTRMKELLLTLKDEKMYVETIFRETIGDDEYLYWYTVQREGGSHVTESKHEVDQLHIEFFKECIDSDYPWKNLSTEVVMIPEAIQQVIKTL